MNALLRNFISARDALYDHCGFKEDWIAYPIESGTIEKYWYIENEVWKQDGTKEESKSTFDGTLRMADTLENLKDENDERKYSEDSLVRHRFFHGKSVYRGKDLTLIIGCPHVDGMIWLYVLDNEKEIKEL
jgi:hypothetical protein